MYLVVLTVHSCLRWLVLIAGLWAMLRGCRGSGVWTPADDRAGRVFVGILDLQVMVGLVLYLAVSPFTQAAFEDFAAAMRNDLLRFFAVEHIFGMLTALVVAHIGRVKTRRSQPVSSRHRAAALWFGAALFLLVASIPWPFLPYGRPLLRW
jgi:hypothetical protein